MKRSLFLALLLCMAFVLATGVSAAESVVYLDGTGATPDAYATLDAAAAAVADGGTVIVSGDTATLTTSGAWQKLPAKAITIMSENGSKLSIGRAITLNGDLTFAGNLVIGNTAGSNLDFIYVNGHTFTVESTVTTTKSASTSRYICVLAGKSSGGAIDGAEIYIYGGTWRSIYGSNYNGTTTGSAKIVFDGATLNGGSIILSNLNGGTSTAAVDVTVAGGTCSLQKINASSVMNGNYTVTLTGGKVTNSDVDMIVDLSKGGSVTVTATTGAITTVAPAGYEVVLEGTTYKSTAVWLDGTGATDGAFTDISAAFTALPANGGTVILCGDTQVGTTAKGVTLPAKTGKVTVLGETPGVKLTVARSLTLAGPLELDNLTLHSTATTSGNLIANGNPFTVGENVTTTKASSAMWLCPFGGAGSGTKTYNTSLVIKAGTYRAIYGGSFGGTLNGTTSVTVSNIVDTGTLSAGNYEGTCNAQTSLVIDLRGGATVKAAIIREGETPTVLTDDGFAYKVEEGLYSEYDPNLAKIISASGSDVMVLAFPDGRLAFLAPVDSLDYAEVGFTVTFDGVAKTFTTDTAYEAITNGTDTYTAETFGATGYVFGILLTDVPAYTAYSVSATLAGGAN